MANPNALNGYSNTTTINTILMMGSTPNSTILSSTASMIATLINFGYGSNTVIGIALNSNVTLCIKKNFIYLTHLGYI